MSTRLRLSLSLPGGEILWRADLTTAKLWSNGQAVCLSHAPPALALSSQGGHLSEVRSILQASKSDVLQKELRYFKSLVSSCYYNWTVYPMKRKHSGFRPLSCVAAWRVALSRTKERHEPSSYSNTYCRPWVRVELSPHSNATFSKLWTSVSPLPSQALIPLHTGLTKTDTVIALQSGTMLFDFLRSLSL